MLRSSLFWTIVGSLAAVVGVIWGVMIYVFPSTSSIEVNGMAQANSISTINISDISDRYFDLKTSLERENFLTQYKGVNIVGSGAFADIGKSNEDLMVAIKTSNDNILCRFNPEWNHKLTLFKIGQKMNFSGIFSGFREFRGALAVNDCNL